jgi:hypothetical protein
MKVVCNKSITCKEKMCGGKIPHEWDKNECGKCPKDKTAFCEPTGDNS